MEMVLIIVGAIWIALYYMRLYIIHQTEKMYGCAPWVLQEHRDKFNQRINAHFDALRFSEEERKRVTPILDQMIQSKTREEARNVATKFLFPEQAKERFITMLEAHGWCWGAKWSESPFKTED